MLHWLPLELSQISSDIDYEKFNDHAHAKDCFERGVRLELDVESYLYIRYSNLSFSPHSHTLLANGNGSSSWPTVSPTKYIRSFTPPPPLSNSGNSPSPSTSLRLCVPPLKIIVPPTSSPTSEARKHLERAAYLHVPAAQYKLGHAYEFVEPPFPFDPFLSVQYSLASEQGESEADMALSKWFLCGSSGAAANAGPDRCL